jgi:hypothetical protein
MEMTAAMQHAVVDGHAIACLAFRLSADNAVKFCFYRRRRVSSCRHTMFAFDGDSAPVRNEEHMSTSVAYGRPPLREIRKPRCANCGIEMWLLHIEPRLAGDVCTFECARCGATEKAETAPGNSVLKLPAAS